jgi:hypothetical protein
VLATEGEAELNFTSQQVYSFSECHIHCKEEETPKTFAFIKIEAKVRWISFPVLFLFLILMHILYFAI